jgi:hypothetical protein
VNFRSCEEEASFKIAANATAVLLFNLYACLIAQLGRSVSLERLK